MHVIDSVINKYLEKVQNNQYNSTPRNSEENVTLYFKLPYLSSFSKRKIRTLLGRYCKNLDIRLVFSSFKVRDLFSVKDPLPRSFRSLVVYKFSFAECNSVYVGETNRHFSTGVREHLSRGKNSHVYKHLKSSESCRTLSK